MKLSVRAGAILGAAVSLCSSSNADVPPPLVPRPNVLVIVLDDTGVEKLNAYSPGLMGLPPTPALTQLAESGVRFTRAYANPKCSPTRAAIMTGRHPFRTGMGENTYTLADGEVTLAELLRDGFSGLPEYRCGAFGKWHLAPWYPDFLNYTHPIIQGFDKFVGHMENVPNHFAWRLIVTEEVDSFWYTDLVPPSDPPDDTTFSASVTREAAVAWINETEDPFFAYVCFNAPHAPFQVPPLNTVSPQTAQTITGYGFEPGDDLTGGVGASWGNDWLIEAVDTEVQNLLDGIQSRLANTTILIVGDNGSPGQMLPDPPYDQSHGKTTVYEQGTLVPLIAAGRGVDAAGSTCSGLVSTVDIWPTIAAFTGAQVPGSVVIDGVSFWQMMDDPSAPSARTKAFVQLFAPPHPWTPNSSAPPDVYWQDRAMNDGRYKYIRKYVAGATPDVTEEAYDLLLDPLEANDLWPGLNSLPPSARMRIQALKLGMIGLSGY